MIKFINSLIFFKKNYRLFIILCINFSSSSFGILIGQATDVKKDQMDKGEYLFHASGCESCHTADHGPRLAGGKPFYISKQGTVYSSNITSDVKTGIQRYTDDEFISALQKGIGHKGKYLYPIMPYTAYRAMSRDEILAIRRYLEKQPALENKVPDKEMAFPYNMRWAIRFWQIINYTGKHFEYNNQKSQSWNRGKFLTEGPGHCSYCHTPENWSNGRFVVKDYAGGGHKGWTAYNITADEDTGIGSWSDTDLEKYLSRGYVSGHGAASGPMADVINTQLSYLTPQDIHAIVIYLRSLRPVEKQQGAAKISVEELEVTEQSHSHGSHLYSSVCSNCHLENGQGRQGEYESLWGSRTATITGGNNLVKVILEGSNLKDPKLGNYMMPSFKDIFNDQDIADIANYVISRFGGRNGHVTAEQVRKERALLNKE